MNKNKLLELIAKNKLNEVLDELFKSLKQSGNIDEIVILSSRFHELKEQINTGTIDNRDKDLELNKIRKSVLSIIKEIDELNLKEHEQISSKNKNPFLILPFGFEIGITKEEDIRNIGFKENKEYSGEKSLFNLKDKLYAYTNKGSGKLITLKIWNMPKSWISSGIKNNLDKTKFSSILSSMNINYSEEDFDTFQTISFYLDGREYWAHFPIDEDVYDSESINKLTFIVVREIEEY